MGSSSFIPIRPSLLILQRQSDGIGGFFSALFTVTPLSIFAQVSIASVFACIATDFILPIEQRCHRDHAVRKSHSWAVLLLLPHPLRRPWQALRRLPRHPEPRPRRRDDVLVRERVRERPARARDDAVLEAGSVRARGGD